MLDATDTAWPASPSSMANSNFDEDYEATNQNGCRIDLYEMSWVPVGQCVRMCSHTEMRERQDNKQLSRYEVIPGTNPPQVDCSRAIKEFKRSAVGREFTVSEDLRPWSVLKKTLRHLLLDICLQQDDWMMISDFVFDRLQAVRQDMIIQRIEGSRYIEVLEGSIRFLVLSLYKLTCTLHDYSQTEPTKRISMKGPVSGLNNYEMHVVREMKMTMKCLRDCLKSLIVQYQLKVPDSPHRALFESVNIVVNLPFVYGHTMSATEWQSKKQLRDKDQIFKTVFKMYREHLSGNHLFALKHLPSLFESPIVILAYASVIAQLQIHIIPLIKKLYSATGPNTSPVRHLCSFICPTWLDPDRDSRIDYSKFMASQFGLYDEQRDLIDYKLNSAKEYFDMKRFESNRLDCATADNETRVYALQMLAGREWSLYSEVIKIHGLQSILDPTQ